MILCTIWYDLEQNTLSRKIWVGFLSLALLGYATYRLMNARTFQLFGTLIARVDTNQKLVALTFDDGPSEAHTDEVLQSLSRNQVYATFFLVGQAIKEHPSEVQAIIAAGHQLGNHSYTHPRLIFSLPSTIQREVDDTTAAIRAAGYSGEIMFRPPFGKKLFYLPYYLSTQNLKTIMWDVEPESYPAVAKDADSIVAHVSAKVRPGSIILLHALSGSQASRDAIEPLIKRLRADGYSFVTVERLLQSR
jgi:peptidoglycan-N-acetylglucosamine deacetylase